MIESKRVREPAKGSVAIKPSPSAPLVSNAPRLSPQFRWYICGLLFFATTINYVDRQVLSLLQPVLEKDLGWTETTYSWIVFAFQLSYAIVMPLAGRAIDYLGTRLGYLISVTVWSIAAAAHALAGNAVGFGFARFGLGIGEAANFPAALKTVSGWFPKHERALATGIFNSGANIGALVAPIMVPYLAIHYGWRSAFVVTGCLGLVWAAAWLMFYRDPVTQHSGLHAASVEHVPYIELLGSRAAWAFLIGKFLTDPVWWFYLFWLPGFLSRTYGLDLSKLGPPLVVIYTASMIGSVGGGWIPAVLLRHGSTVNRARKAAMLICAFAVTAAIFTYNANSLWLAVTLISIAAAAHQGWSANIFNLPSDVFPQRAVASVVGLGGMGGAAGGLLASPAIGHWLDWSHGAYGILFVIAGSLYLIALGIIHLLVPDLDHARQSFQ